MVTLAVNVTGTPEQIVLEVDVMLTVGAPAVPIVMVIVLELTVVVVAQAILLVISQETTSLLFNVRVEYVLAFTPTLLPFNFHWKLGLDPPFVGVAVNNTLVLAQTTLVVVAIESVGVTTGLTEMPIRFDDETVGLAQVLLDVTTQ